MSNIVFKERMGMMNFDKSNLKLDLENKATTNTGRKRKIFSLHSPAGLLQSPDLKLLKLASPELERIIINNNGFIPTPMTPGGPSGILTGGENEDQESFARGFVEALQKLQEQDIPVSLTASSKLWATPTPRSDVSASTHQPTTTSTTGPTAHSLPPPPSRADPNRNSVPVITPNRYDRSTPPNIHTPPPPVLSTFPPQTASPPSTTMQLTPNPPPPPPRSTTTYLNRPDNNRTTLQTSGITLPTPISSMSALRTQIPPPSMDIKSEDESLISPPLSVQGDSMNHLDMNPINLDQQEQIKHQRKKLRNRLAAQRCRKRKIEREDTLKDKVKELRQKNNDLTCLSRDLRTQVCELKQQVMQHVNQGCHVFLKDSDGEKTDSS
jgi:hypothetical protein